MDKVFIEALEIDCVIGIYDWERKIRQPVVLDIEMAFDNRKPAASDDIADTLDYKAISKRLIQFVGESSFGLVETLAEHCCRIIIDEFGVAKVQAEAEQARRGARRQGGRRDPRALARRTSRRRDRRHAGLMAQGLPQPGLEPGRRQQHLPRRSPSCAHASATSLVSPVYRTPAVGFDGPDFLNAAVVIDTDLDIVALDAWLHALEDRHGRRRDVPRFSSRPLDIDIVFYDYAGAARRRQPADAAPGTAPRLRAQAAGRHRAGLPRSAQRPDAGRTVGSAPGRTPRRRRSSTLPLAD